MVDVCGKNPQTVDVRKYQTRSSLTMGERREEKLVMEIKDN